MVRKGKINEAKVLAAQPKLLVKQVKTASKPYLTLQHRALPLLVFLAAGKPPH
jgi:hypothetical protein